VDGAAVAVYNVDGTFYATQDECTHADGPLSDGYLDGPTVVCPWHDSCFDVTDGAVLKGPATEPLRVYHVTVDGDVGWVE
jgi:nitrite reductase/ring-hydroxylating ferredoxin subunit